jgi:hypothetical protein
VPAKKSTAAPPALTNADVTELRTRVAGGEKPRVVVRTASAAVPAGTRGNVVRLGDPKDGEYIVVRLGRDEVPFAPAELGIPGRKAAPAAPSAASPETAAAAPRATTTAPRAPRSSTTRKPAKRVPPLTVTLRFREGSWTIEGQRGARRIAKPGDLRPGAVSALADHVEDDALREALVEAVESSRSLVEAERAALREKLQAAEATLRDYDARPARKRAN